MMLRVNKLSPEISAKIATLSFAASCCVVDIHIGCLKSAACGSWTWWWGQCIHGGLWRCVVPMFFFISGYLLAGHVGEKGWWKDALRKRARTIVVPYFVWSLFYFLLSVPLILVANFRAGRSLMTNIPMGMALINFFGINPCVWPGYYAFWYLRALLVVILISPLLVWGVRKLGVCFVLVLFMLLAYWNPCYLFPSVPSILFETTLSRSGLFYVALGMYIRMSGVVLSRRIGIVILAITCALSVLFVTNHLPHVFKQDLFIIGIVLGVWFSVDGVRLPKLFASLAFPIYCSHLCFLLLYRTLIAKTESGIGAEILAWAIVLLGSISFAFAMRRFMPLLSRIALGGR